MSISWPISPSSSSTIYRGSRTWRRKCLRWRGSRRCRYRQIRNWTGCSGSCWRITQTSRTTSTRTRTDISRKILKRSRGRTSLWIPLISSTTEGLWGASAHRMSGRRARSGLHLQRSRRPTCSRQCLPQSKPHLRQKLFARVLCTRWTWRTASSQGVWCRKERGAPTTRMLSKGATGRPCSRVGLRWGSSKQMPCWYKL